MAQRMESVPASRRQACAVESGRSAVGDVRR
jgi:hypothetical protein